MKGNSAVQEEHGGEVLKIGLFDMQVCVPGEFTDQMIVEFAEEKNPCGTDKGWHIRKDENLLAGDPVRNPCAKKIGFVHVMLDA